MTLAERQQLVVALCWPVATDRQTVEIAWPASLPIPSDEQEAAILMSGALFPAVKIRDARHAVSTVKPRLKQSAAPLYWDDLDAGQQARITSASAAAGLDVRQAMGLRKAVYQSACPWRCGGDEEAALAAACAVEDAVEAYLARKGVSFATQAQQVEAYAEHECRLGPTPDFLLTSPLLINGQPAQWIEVKNFYGVGLVDGLKEWMPHVKMQRQVAKYTDTFGPGAVLFSYGYSEALRRRTPAGVQLVDAGQLSMPALC